VLDTPAIRLMRVLTFRSLYRCRSCDALFEAHRCRSCDALFEALGFTSILARGQPEDQSDKRSKR
jgi:hypothetical protein